MKLNGAENPLEEWRKKYPEKFASEDQIFNRIHRGSHIFIGTACGEPQYLIQALINYVSSHPKVIFDAEMIHIWTLGVAPYAEKKFSDNFRHNSFFIGKHTRESINQGLADYTPIFLSQLPDLFYRKIIPIDVALIQTSPPDRHGYLSLGVSVDVVKAAVEVASLVIAQVNSHMPRVHGDGFLPISDVDFLLPHDEPILEYHGDPDDEVIRKIGNYVSRLVQDGDTIQVGYGSIPNAILANLKEKKHLGIHTELLSDGIAELLKIGAVDNSKKTINRGKTVTSFCMGSPETYAYIHDNPAIEFRTIDYTNNPLIIAQHDNMVAINSTLDVDLTGQATAESIGHVFYSGIGGQADFMRGAMLARNGKTILALPSTAENGAISRIVPYLEEGSGITLNRGDVHYVVTEYGIAYLHGKNIRERAMELIAIAHPKFRAGLIEEAKKYHLIYSDQEFIPGEKGEYPEELEILRTLKNGQEILLRPVKISDEPLLKDLFYSLSDKSLERRFLSMRKDMHHDRLQKYVIVDYSRQMFIVAVKKQEDKEEILGLGQYILEANSQNAEAAFITRDDCQGQGIGRELLSYLTLLAKKQGLLGFTATVLAENRPMLHLFETMGFDLTKHIEDGVYELKMGFKPGTE
ncbi:MAG: GNAT family N-acetyltransferase [bacterium]|nr:GNAT family N-acetyltransferase [bacterium]